MKQSVILFILLFCGAVLAQEADVDQTVGEPDEAVEADTLAEEETEEDLEFEEADEDTLAPEAAAPVESETALTAGYKNYLWGMAKDQFEGSTDGDTAATSDDNSVTVSGTLGQDTVTYVYSFSDKGFWKVRIDYDTEAKVTDDYIEDFHRVEGLLTKRYGHPKRTSQNDMGIGQEYLFSDFPKISRAYFRTSWKVDTVHIELLLDAVAPYDPEDVPVFDDVPSVLRLYYYHPTFYGTVEPETPEIPEENLLEEY
jgi:hypothetical protein